MTSATIISLALIVGYLSTLTFAARFGGRAERVGAAIYAMSLVLTWGTQATGERAPLIAFIGIDLATTLAFGALMFRYPDKLWPGISACAHLLIVVFSATRALDFPLSENGYLAMLNVSGLAGFGALALGTWAQRWLRRVPDPWDLAAAELSRRDNARHQAG